MISSAPIGLVSHCEVFAANAWFRGRSIEMEPQSAERFKVNLEAEMLGGGSDWFRVIARGLPEEVVPGSFDLAVRRAQVVLDLIAGVGITRDRAEVVIEQRWWTLSPGDDPSSGLVTVNRMVDARAAKEFDQSGKIC